MNKLKEIRMKKKISQEKLAFYLGVSRSTVAMWETGNSQPDNQMLIKIADYFNVTTDYLLGRNQENNNIIVNGIEIEEMDEKSFLKALEKIDDAINIHKRVAYGFPEKIADIINIKKDVIYGFPKKIADCFSELSDKNKEIIFSMIKSTYEMEKNALHKIESAELKTKKIPLYGKVVAGPHIEMINDTADTIEVPDDLEADYALTIKGDSMEDIYPEGSVVLVKNQFRLENSQIGIFRVNNEDATCKKYKLEQRADGGINQILLYCNSKKYPDKEIQINEGDFFQILGRVISKYNG